MTKIVYVPLDERPVNLVFPQRLAKITDLTLCVPSKSILGRKKKPADLHAIKDWGYQAVVRQNVCLEDLPSFGVDSFNLGNNQKEIQFIIHNKLMTFIQQYLPTKEVTLENVVLPWDRMFEIGFDLSIKTASISAI